MHKVIHFAKQSQFRLKGTCGAEGLLLLFLFVSLRLAKSNAFSAAIIVDDFNAGGLQRSAQRGFIREGCWDFPIDDLDPTDSRYPDF